jgi:hypothetical protein
MTSTTTTNQLPNTIDLLTAGAVVDQLAGLSVDQLRALQGRLEDSQRSIKALLRERMTLARRDTAWRARELAMEEEPPCFAGQSNRGRPQ